MSGAWRPGGTASWSAGIRYQPYWRTERGAIHRKLSELLARCFLWQSVRQFVEIIEEAESELVRRIEWPMNRSMGYDFPRVHLECRFIRVISLDDAFVLRLKIGKLGRTSIRYEYQVFGADKELAIEGTMTIVVLQDGKPTPIPDPLRAALEAEDSFSA